MEATTTTTTSTTTGGAQFVHQLNQPIELIQFDSTLPVKVLVVGFGDIKTVIERVRPFLLNKPRIKNVQAPKDSDKRKKFKMVVLNEECRLQMPKELLEVIEEFKIEVEDFEISMSYTELSYSQALKKLIPEGINVPGGYETIGRIAHLNLREDQYPYKFLIGKVILDKASRVKTVVNKLEKLNNVYRTPILEVIAGEACYETVHVEGALNFKLDFEKVYWCSRLHQERMRVLATLQPGQTICDAFCGVGPFALRAAHEKSCLVYASDLNPACYKYLKINIEVNGLQGKVIPDCKDARDFIRETLLKMYEGKAERVDRFYLNLPADAIEFLDVFCQFYQQSPQYLQESKFVSSQAHTYCFLEVADEETRMTNLLARVRKVMPNIQRKDIVDLHCLKSVSSEKEMYCVTVSLCRRNCSLIWQDL